MGYDIWATGGVVQNNGKGYRYPNYVKKNRHWGDEWEMNQLLDVALTMKGINTGGSISGGLQIKLMKGLAMATFKRLLGQTLQILTLDSRGELSIFTRNKNLVWADETHFKKFHFTLETVNMEYRSLLKFLVKADLNKMGPLLDLNFALSDWSAKGKSGRYLYSFSYTWS